MYRILRNPTYWRTITALQPDDLGDLQPANFDARYRALDETAHTALMEEFREGKLSDADGCRRFVVELRGLADEKGQALASTADLLDHMLLQPGIAGALVKEYFESRMEVALGNLPKPLAVGQAAAPQATTHH